MSHFILNEIIRALSSTKLNLHIMFNGLQIQLSFYFNSMYYRFSIFSLFFFFLLWLLAHPSVFSSMLSVFLMSKKSKEKNVYIFTYLRLLGFTDSPRHLLFPSHIFFYLRLFYFFTLRSCCFHCTFSCFIILTFMGKIPKTATHKIKWHNLI